MSGQSMQPEKIQCPCCDGENQGEPYEGKSNLNWTHSYMSLAADAPVDFVEFYCLSGGKVAAPCHSRDLSQRLFIKRTPRLSSSRIDHQASMCTDSHRVD